MAARKRKSTLGSWIALAFLIVFAATNEDFPAGTLSYVLLCLFVALLLYPLARRVQKKLARRRARRLIDDCIAQHIETLRAKFGEMVYQDDYGTWVFDEFLAEVGYFEERVIVNQLTPIEDGGSPDFNMAVLELVAEGYARERILEHVQPDTEAAT